MTTRETGAATQAQDDVRRLADLYCETKDRIVGLLDDPASSLERKDALSQTRKGHCLRNDRWAYMWYSSASKKREGFMLYDMESDPRQYENLANDPEHASIKRQLHARLMKRIEAAKN